MEEMKIENEDINIKRIGIDYNKPLIMITEKKIKNVEFDDYVMEIYFKDE
jgi:hypothetical protein